MTTNERFERSLAAWLHDDAAFRVPDHLGEVVATTREMRQRPAWSSLERWLPVDTTFRPRLVTLPSTGRLLAVAALILVLLAVAMFAIGSQRRLPEPFGLARNGAFVGSRDGDIYRIDPETAGSQPLVTGDGFDFSPLFSRDGTQLLFLRSESPLSTTEPAVLTMYVANADGSAPRALTSPTKSLDWFDWSPDGSQVAYVSEGVLYVVDVAGGGSRRLVGAGRLHFPTWLPPDGKEILFRQETRSPGIFAIDPDGQHKRRVVSKTAPNNEFDYQSMALSPDGSHLTFTRWLKSGPDGRPYPASLGWLPRVYVMDVATGAEMELPTPPGTGTRGAAVYSPDGEHVAYARIYREGAFELVVADADGSGNERVVGERRLGRPDGSEVEAAWTFTPDGNALIVRYGSDDQGKMVLMPLDGSTPVELGSGRFEFVDVQRLAR
jgi:Tol biopolymer transport system component